MYKYYTRMHVNASNQLQMSGGGGALVHSRTQWGLRTHDKWSWYLHFARACCRAEKRLRYP